MSDEQIDTQPAEAEPRTAPTSTQKLYVVLREGIKQRGTDGSWSVPKRDDVIAVSDVAAPWLIRERWIEPAKEDARLTPPRLTKTTEVPVPGGAS